MKNSMVRTTVLTAVLAVFLAGGIMSAGCSSSDNDPDSRLYTVWQLMEFVLDDGTVVAVDEPLKYTIEFRTDNTDTIRADCNTCNGNFTADDKKLRFGPQACTLAACAAGSFDAQFQAALGSVSEYNIDVSLFLEYTGGMMRLAPVPTLF
jgi:heat shock protein HslJ